MNQFRSNFQTEAICLSIKHSEETANVLKLKSEDIFAAKKNDIKNYPYKHSNNDIIWAAWLRIQLGKFSAGKGLREFSHICWVKLDQSDIVFTNKTLKVIFPDVKLIR